MAVADRLRGEALGRWARSGRRLPGGGGGKCHLEMGFRMANAAPDVLFLLNVETHPTLTLSPPPQKSMQDSQDGRCRLKVVPLES